MITRIEDVESPVIGKFYDVPCVVWQWKPDLWYCSPSWMMRFNPILGPEHEDTDIIGFQHDHWHIDWRFVSPRSFVIAGMNKQEGDSARSAHVFTARQTDGTIYRKVLKMKRGHCLFPGRSTEKQNPWLGKLEAKYAWRSLKCGLCPHRGVSLANAPLENGLRAFSGAGLAFDKNGILTPRT